MKKIDTLTSEQTELISEVRESWIKFYLAGDSGLNRESASNGIRWLYGLAKLKPPFIIFVDSPMACQYASSVVKAWLGNGIIFDQVSSQVCSQVDSQVFDQVISQVDRQVCDKVISQVFDQLSSQVISQVDRQVFDQVRSQVDRQFSSPVSSQVSSPVISQVFDQVISKVDRQVSSQVSSQVCIQVFDQVRSQVIDQVCDKVSSGEFFPFAYNDGGFDSGWVAFYDFF